MSTEDKPVFYFAAVVPDKHEPIEHTPFVSTALGPYQEDETEAITRAHDFLRDAYGTEDVRRIPVWPPADFEGARKICVRDVGREWVQKRKTAHYERSKDALKALQPEQWVKLGYPAPNQGLRDVTFSLSADTSVAMRQLDDVLDLLGVDPHNV